MLYMTPFITAYCIFLAALTGSCMGSFLNCMAWRIVHGESVTKGRSHCDECGHVLGPADLVPVFSYLIHKGKCRYCGASLSKRHLIAEVLSAIVFVSILLKFNISLQALKYMIFACVLLAASFADLEGCIIPDRFIASGIVIYAAFLPFAGNPKAECINGLIGGFAVAAAVLLIVLTFEKIKKVEAMGGGDIKLLFLTGLFLGWKLNLLCLLFACFIGIIFGLAFSAGKEEKTFPWGPSIALAAWLCLLVGNELVTWYLGLLF